MLTKFVLICLLAVVNAAKANEFVLYFPKDYSDSVHRFQQLAASKKSPAAVAGFLRTNHPIDHDLQTNYAYYPAKTPTNLLVIISGVHGPEAFAGSAIQQMIMNEIIPQVDLQKTGILLIHAVNPFGFKHVRRVNENNVDLNRNFPVQDNLYSLENTGYDNLAELLEPKRKVSFPGLNSLWKDLQLIGGLVLGKYSVKEIGNSIGQGQHVSPLGLEYGGVNPESQVKVVQQIIQHFSSSYNNVVFVDIHTGLGSKNQLHLMTGNGISYHSNALLKLLLRLDIDEDNYDLATGDDPGFYPTPGDIIDYLPKLLRSNQKSIAFTAEFGTIGTGVIHQLETLNRLILENQGFHYGYSDSTIKNKVENRFLDLFNPNEKQWQELTLTKSRYLFQVLLERLEEQKLIGEKSGGL
jgi:hypothetical protein